jgi:iron complex outermembrane receptor protein
VEVTATRIPEDVDSVPAPIEVITGDELRDWGAVDLRSALSMAAGVDFAPGADSGPASSVPEFWGLKELDAFLLVVDGVPWGGAFNPALSTLNLTDVERIEILRGPAPVMYGATSFVGVVHVIHRDAGYAASLASVRGGSYGSGSADLNLRLGRWGGFDSRASVDAERRGFRDDRTGFRRGHVLWRNSRTVGKGSFRLDVDGTWLDQDPASPHPRMGTALTTRVPLDVNHNPTGAFINDRRLVLTGSLDLPAGSAAWSTSLSFARNKDDSFRGFLVNVTESDPNAHGFRNTIRTTDIYFDTHLSWATSPRIKLVAGLDHLHGNGNARGGDFDYFVNLDGSNPPTSAELPPAADIHINDRRDFSGLYGFVEWTPHPQWRLELGGRLNRTDESRDTSLLDLASGDLTQGSGALKKVRASETAAVLWTPWERGRDAVRLFASYRNSYKPAAIDFGLDSPAAILKPETTASYEIGLKSRSCEGKLSLEISTFLMDFKNLVIAQTINGLPALTNAGQQRFKGIELAAAWRLTNHVSGRATYSFHDAKFTDFIAEFDGVPTQLAGKRLEMSARHMASAGLIYAPDQGVFGGAEINWVGSRFLDKRNRSLADGYRTLAAGIGYRKRRWEVRFDGRNLNDERVPVSESELGDAQYYRLPARRLDVTAALKF